MKMRTWIVKMMKPAPADLHAELEITAANIDNAIPWLTRSRYRRRPSHHKC
jgi:hypothetical protein